MLTNPPTGNEALQVASTNLNEVLLEISAIRLTRFAMVPWTGI